jgi:hypothetical protein
MSIVPKKKNKKKKTEKRGGRQKKSRVQRTNELYVSDGERSRTQKQDMGKNINRCMMKEM